MKKYLLVLIGVLFFVGSVLPVQVFAAGASGSCYFDPAKKSSYFKQSEMGGNTGLGITINYGGTDSYYATPEAAAQLGECLGDSVFEHVLTNADSVFSIPPRYEITLSNGITTPVGLLLRDYFNFNAHSDPSIWSGMEFCASLVGGNGCGALSTAGIFMGYGAPEFYTSFGLAVPDFGDNTVKFGVPPASPVTVTPVAPVTPATNPTPVPATNPSSALIGIYLKNLTDTVNRMIETYKGMLYTNSSATSQIYNANTAATIKNIADIVNNITVSYKAMLAK